MKLVLITLLLALAYGLTTAPENCWNNYTTEQSAILNCEK